MALLLLWLKGKLKACEEVLRRVLRTFLSRRRSNAPLAHRTSLTSAKNLENKGSVFIGHRTLTEMNLNGKPKPAFAFLPPGKHKRVFVVGSLKNQQREQNIPGPSGDPKF